MSNDLPREIFFPGITPSSAFFREPQGNGCAEGFVRTLKKNPVSAFRAFPLGLTDVHGLLDLPET